MTFWNDDNDVNITTQILIDQHTIPMKPLVLRIYDLPFSSASENERIRGFLILDNFLFMYHADTHSPHFSIW